MPDSGEIDLVQLVNRYHRFRSSARFLQVVSMDDKLFNTLLLASGISNDSVYATTKLRNTIISAGNKANILKLLNVLWIMVGLTLIVLATAWPEIDSRLQLSSNTLLVILIQVALLALAAFCGDQYHHCKSQQTEFEVALRATLFNKELLNTKICRLDRILRKLSLFRKPTISPKRITKIRWKFDTTESLVDHYKITNTYKINKNDAAVLAIQLKDAAIKRMAYSFLVNCFFSLTFLVVVTGIFLHILLSILGNPIDQNLISSYQALLIAGFGGLFWALRKQYIEKYQVIQLAMEELMSNSGELNSKASKFHDELAKIDDGMVI